MVPLDLWNSEKLNNSLKDIDRAIDSQQFNRATTLAYTCLEGLYPQPVGRATFVEWVEDDVEQDLSDEDIAESLNVGQWITFSALACRRYSNCMGYCNADDLHFVAQRFDPARPGALSMTIRRRDGSTHNFISKQGGIPIFLRPYHAQATRVELDIPLIEALLKAEEPDLRDKLLSAISVFNRANTDAHGFPQASEIILMRVTFETLLGAGHATKEIHAELVKHFAGELAARTGGARDSYVEAIKIQRVKIGEQSGKFRRHTTPILSM